MAKYKYIIFIPYAHTCMYMVLDLIKAAINTIIGNVIYSLSATFN